MGKVFCVLCIIFLFQTSKIYPQSLPDYTLFEYEKTDSLNFQEALLDTNKFFSVREISYDSPVIGRVSGILYKPNTSGNVDNPAILMMHGMPGNKWTMKNLSEAYARSGSVVLAISAPFNRVGELPHRKKTRLFPAPLLSEYDKDEIVQAVLDLRRALDILEFLPGIDENRIAYIGHSFGGYLGGLLLAVETRIKAYVLMAPTSGLLTWISNNPSNWIIQIAYNRLSEKEKKDWRSSMAKVESPLWLSHSTTNIPLLVQAGTKDLHVKKKDTFKFFESANDPKQLEWYETGHNLSRKAFEDQAIFLATILEFNVARFIPPDKLANKES